MIQADIHSYGKPNATDRASRHRFDDFQGKTAIITGAASGIGLALAEALAARGADLALADIDARGLDTARERLETSGRRICTRVLDVSSDSDVRDAASEFEAALGKVHLVFNNAGIDMSGELASLSEEDWRRVFGVNVFGVVHGIRHFLPLLRHHGEPAHIINTASGAGFWVNRDFSMGAYAATKYSVVALSEALEQELSGTGIGVSVLCPGPVNTPIAEHSSHTSELFKATIAAGAAPELVANLTLEAIRSGEFYIFSPTRMRPRVEQRFARILDALERAPA
ncbi:1-deoxy-11-beta-hydroxypentalenate dehydrogenase [Cupriavidus yeoncheonensis]|uniref:1-deoxy-11-beta-hydroxypentalenate dehydrogenase n=1 Tax=Cupriavidus yeoncheonensis TaxID=1462994 RepID=A0A916N0Y8_9BURK|nr:SDR family NAD(P)-dependent oxidoreductase [Cupriavidus yeoncheonensis]CAG2158388.1 1-deoxy-11-beta-hydroxypentalenate dehydrogenase [Cupriavidus yeoncheonensis]